LTSNNAKVLDLFGERADYKKFVSDNFHGSSKKNPLVVVLNDYMPAYRAQLFTMLEKQLASKSIDFQLVTGNPDKKFLLRRDMATAPFHMVARNFTLKLGDSAFRYIFSRKHTKRASIVVCEFSITNINTWLHIVFDKKKDIFLWGHGPGYLAQQSWMRTKLEMFLARKAKRVLLYTKPGMERLVELGLDPAKVDYLNNTFDWTGITSAIEAADDKALSDFLERHELTSGKVFCSIGAIDHTKRIDFLADVMESTWVLDPEVKFLFAGEGPEKAKLDKAVRRGQAILLGRIGNSEKAILAKMSSGILNPGNIGLVAVDSLAMNVPIIGTGVQSSPEKDYLVEGISLHTLSNNPEVFGRELLTLLEKPNKPISSGIPPRVEDFVQRFASNLIQRIRPEKPRVLFLTNLPAPYRVSLFNAMASDFEITVGFTGWADEGRDWLLPQSEKVKFRVVDAGHLLGLGRFKIPLPRFGIAGLIRDFDLVVVGGWNSPVYVASLLLAKKMKIYSAVWFESTLRSSASLGRKLKGLKSWVFSLGDFVLTPGQSASTAVKTYTANSVPIVQSSNPVEDVFLGKNIQRKLAPSGNVGTKYLYFGRLLSWKAVDQLILAFDKIAEPADTLSIVGSGEEEKSLKSLARKSLRHAQIKFLGAVPHQEAIVTYKSYDVLVLPSQREVWGMVVPEALLMGLNVVADHSVGCVESYREVNSLLTFSSRSTESFADCLRLAKNHIEMTVEQKRKIMILNDPYEFSSRLRKLFDELDKQKYLS
jgi:glycosyltransferase involved in cell wall biosynthesis